MTQSQDLDTPERIAELVPRFYKRVEHDEHLRPIFVDVAQVDWEAHMPKLIAFWCQMVLGIPGFHGNPAGKHVQFSKLHAFEKHHFDRWIGLFHDTIDRSWRGPKAEEIKARSTQIARYQAQLVGAGEWNPPDTRSLPSNESPDLQA